MCFHVASRYILAVSLAISLTIAIIVVRRHTSSFQSGHCKLNEITVDQDKRDATLNFTFTPENATPFPSPAAITRPCTAFKDPNFCQQPAGYEGKSEPCWYFKSQPPDSAFSFRSPQSAFNLFSATFAVAFWFSCLSLCILFGTPRHHKPPPRPDHQVDPPNAFPSAPPPPVARPHPLRTADTSPAWFTNDYARKLYEDDWLCAICLEPEEGAPSIQDLAPLQCQHVFHAVCLRSWIGQGGNVCPCCRRNVNQESVSS